MNRTIVELRPFYFSWNSRLLPLYESNHSGIETYRGLEQLVHLLGV